MLSWLWDRTWSEVSLFFLVANLGVFLGSVLLCWLLGRYFSRNRIFQEWEPLRPVEFAAAFGSIVFNAVVSLFGWHLWKLHIINLPETSIGRSVFDAIFMLLAMDLGMYVLHRLAHHPVIYPLFHTFHHRHESTNPISLFVLHPIEVLGFGCLMIVFLICYPTSPDGLIAYLAVNVLWGTLGHSGVKPFPKIVQKIPIVRLLGTSTFHAEHHESPRGNFGFYTLIWDRMFGTLNPTYDQHFRNTASRTNLGSGKPLG